MEGTLPLHLCHVKTSTAIINRSHMLLHFIALIALFYYRLSYLFQETLIDKTILPWLLVFASELMLSFLWILDQAFRWRPVARTVFPERLPKDEKLPTLDVFICTADPDREPIMGVMNTVLSAMALDYPPGKLSVYLSDDSGTPSTLYAMKKALEFARQWLPFCRTHGIKTICPDAYFSSQDDDFGDLQGTEFIAQREKIKGEYELFKESVKEAIENDVIMAKNISTSQDHSPVIEIIYDDDSIDDAGEENAKMPRLVYVSREKRISEPHHFKAGALNTLLRVSGVMSNSPYILVLDCDMYCNDPSSAKQAMCFHLDPKISTVLAFVQFPQKFHNIGKNDIYDSRLRSLFTTQWEGLDGLLGPVLSGTCFYMKRRALYGTPIPEVANHMEHKRSFGPSNQFIESLNQDYKRNSNEFIEEAHILASCTYENHTKWGKEVGFMYYSVVEDYFTGFMLHCKGWTSVFCTPSRPHFLGSATINLNDVLAQQIRWYSGLLGVGISRFCPLLYGPGASFLESMCYAQLAFFPLYCLPFWCLATVPQLCLLHGIPLFPQVSNPFFIIYTFIFVSSVLKHLYEVIQAGGSIRTWIDEQRIWMIKSVTSHFYGSLDAVMNKFGIKDTNFIPTNKVINDQQLKLYKAGKFDFQATTLFLVPMVSLVILNTVSLVVGITKLIFMGDGENLFIQVGISLFGLSMSYPLLEGMIVRKDKGCIPWKAILSSCIFLVCFLSLGSIMLA